MTEKKHQHKTNNLNGNERRALESRNMNDSYMFYNLSQEGKCKLKLFGDSISPTSVATTKKT